MSCYPEAAMWNALVDGWGMTLMEGYMFEAWRAPGSAYAQELPPAPTLDEISAWARARQAKRKKGLAPDAPDSLPTAAARRKPPVDALEPGQMNETCFDGPGQRMSDRGFAGAPHVKLAVGFHLYVRSTQNEKQKWPAAERCTGMALLAACLECVTQAPDFQGCEAPLCGGP